MPVASISRAASTASVGLASMPAICPPAMRTRALGNGPAGVYTVPPLTTRSYCDPTLGLQMLQMGRANPVVEIEVGDRSQCVAPCILGIPQRFGGAGEDVEVAYGDKQILLDVIGHDCLGDPHVACRERIEDLPMTFGVLGLRDLARDQKAYADRLAAYRLHGRFEPRAVGAAIDRGVEAAVGRRHRRRVAPG